MHLILQLTRYIHGGGTFIRRKCFLKKTCHRDGRLEMSYGQISTNADPADEAKTDHDDRDGYPPK